MSPKDRSLLQVHHQKEVKFPMIEIITHMTGVAIKEVNMGPELRKVFFTGEGKPTENNGGGEGEV